MDNRFISRALENKITEALTHFSSVTITGPRQSGKTTLCRKLFPQLPYVNLEDINTLKNAQDDIVSFVNNFPNGAIFDEVQNLPEILSALQVLIDDDIFRGNKTRKFIITGSSDFTLMETVSQSMSGRTEVFKLLPFSLNELGDKIEDTATDTLILNGGYPAVWNTPQLRHTIISGYYNTYVERDIKRLINIKDMITFNKFIRLCAGRIGTEFNASTLSNEVGASVPTIQNWLSILAASYIIYLLPPYSGNLKKRIIKTPKIYFYDTALAAFLLGINNETVLNVHPLRGALFENMVVNEMVKHSLNSGEEPNLYFYRDQSQREVDVVNVKAQGIELYEIKSSMSYNTDYFKNLKYLTGLMPEQVIKSGVIYDGKEQRTTVLEGLTNFRSLLSGRRF